MRKCFFVFLLTTLSISAVAAKVDQNEALLEQPKQLFLNAESVFFSHDDKQGWLPGFGLSIGQTTGLRSGWLWDAGFYAAFDKNSGEVFAPLFFHFGYQIGKHLRLWGYVAGVLIEDFGESGKTFPLLVVGPELEVLPIHAERVQFSVLAGIPTVYVLIPTYPYVGSRAVVSLTDFLSVQTLLRYAFTEDYLLGSAGLMVKF